MRRLKQRDLLLLALPLGALALVVLAVTLLVVQFRAFEHSYLDEARAALAERTQFFAGLLRDDLKNRDFDTVSKRIAYFCGRPLRITIIDSAGNVVADSDAPKASLVNHASRPEVLAAEPLIPDPGSEAHHAFSMRYSVTMGSWLLYHAVREGDWVIRASIPMSTINRVLTQVRWEIAFALLIGAGLVAFLLAYLFLRVRPQFITLQNAATAIARGHLQTPIPIPRGGPLRELTQAVAIMGRQLRFRIDDLRRERNEFDALFNTMHEPLLLVSQDGEILRANRAAATLFGESIRWKGFRIERTASPALVDYVREAFKEPVIHSREIALQEGTGERSLLAHAVRMERNGALCLLLVLTDLTDLRRLESLRSDFVANVSHEIKTPLTAILSTVETLLDTPLDEPARKRCLEILARQSRRLGDLVQDILSLAAIERRQGSPETAFTSLHLNALLQGAIALCQDEADQRGIELRLHLCPDNGVTLFGDPRLLEQALVNLISNALRHASSPYVELSCAVQGQDVQIAVRDAGCGIAPEHLPRLFERFYRVHKDRSRENGGTGLGLAIVKHTALLHHGSVDVSSTPGEGTTFTLHLPLSGERPA